MLGRPAWDRATTAWRDAVTAAHLVTRLPRLLRRPVSGSEARSALRHRLDRRAADFLITVRRGIYEVAGHPCRALLIHAGCEPGDLNRLVRDEGVEGALGALLKAGVYLTVDELKGRCPIRRGSLSLTTEPSSFVNRAVRPGIPCTTGGSRGPRTRVDVDLQFLWEGATGYRLTLEARGGVDWRFAVWAVPGGAALSQILNPAMATSHTPQFFSRLDPSADDVARRYHQSFSVVRLAGLLAGRPFPPEAHASLLDPAPLVHWLDDVRDRGETPQVHLYASAAVRLAQAALALGTDLRGVQLLTSGEPLTPARRAAVEHASGVAFPLMGNIELGTTVASGCLAPRESDDMHVAHDMLAIVQPDLLDLPGLPRNALLASAIRPRAPLLFLNASLGDVGHLSEEACGCPMARIGWTTRVTKVRSYEKLTAGGMTFYDSELTTTLEEALPARFGGGPLDYQLVEEEGSDGTPRLRLLIHPAVGPLEPAAVIAAFLDGIGDGRDLKRMMGSTWREGGFVQVERRPPETTGGGKIQHLHSTARSRPTQVVS